MTQFRAFDSRVEVNGRTVLSVVAGMQAFEGTARRILQKNGIVDPGPDTWFRQQDWLNAFGEVASGVGSATLFNIGKHIPENADFPPEIDNIVAALGAIDIAYHMNHRIEGELLFDGATGTTHDGIGDYQLVESGSNHAIMRCHNPYPCEFDRGIISAMAERFRPDARRHVRVEHVEGECRKHGDEVCLYRVEW